MDLVNALSVSLVLSIGFMSGVFFIGRRKGRYDVFDMAWGLVFIVIALGVLAYNSISQQSYMQSGQLLITALVAIWGSRLATHIGHRLQRTTAEDPRYVEMRSKWKGKMARNIFFRIYMLQAVLAVIIALPVILVNSSQYSILPVFLLAGAAVWLVGFVVESVADLQLESFVMRYPGQLMTTGLWKYSRHPNYFGEMVQWWGLGVMALSVSYGWLGLIGPTVLTFLLLYVSGVPIAEKRSERREGWAAYKHRTSAVFPLPPSKP